SFSKTVTFAFAALALAGSLTGAAQAQDGYQRWFDVVNTSRTTPIYSVFATNRDDRSFGRDLLGDNMA
ncbi:hypothetical protein, partial [Streptococcus pneumoniae]|uniref:hypothetical protein n=1 Tax=Streptococcus pneumoniae TaxID=1313 RepID=UPI0013D9C78E